MSMLVNPFWTPAAPGHRYWGIRVNSVDGGGSFTVGDLEFYESNGGPNVASGLTGQTTYGGGFTFGQSFAFDGGAGDPGYTGDRMNVSVNATSGFIVYGDFGAGNSKSIRKIGILACDDAYVSTMPATFDVVYSDDGSNWTTAWSVASGSSSWGGYEFRTFTDPGYSAPSYSGSKWGSHQYWRIMSYAAAGNAYSAVEVEMRAAPSGADQCSGGTGSAWQSFSGSFDGPKAFDDNAGTFWSSSAKAAGGWLKYVFGSAVTVSEVTWLSRDDASYAQAPTLMVVQFSDDGTHWTTAWQIGPLSAWSQNQTRTFTDPAYV